MRIISFVLALKFQQCLGLWDSVEHLTILGRTFECLTDTGTVADKTYVSKKLRPRFENHAQGYNIFLCIDTVGVAFTDSVGEQVGCFFRLDKNSLEC